MKKNILFLLTILCVTFSIMGCNKDKDSMNIIVDNTTKNELTKEEQKFIEEKLEEINTQLLEDNKSIDTGKFLVDSSIDLSNDNTTLDKYVYIKNENLTFITTDYVSNHIIAKDTNDSVYNYYIFTNTEDVKLVDNFLNVYNVKKSKDETIELKNVGETKTLNFENNTLISKTLSMGNNVLNENYYMLAFLLDDTTNSETFLVATYYTQSDEILNDEELFKKLYNGISIKY